MLYLTFPVFTNVFKIETLVMGIAELQCMAATIEREIEECENDLKRVGSLTIKTQSFSNLLSKQDESDKEIKLLKIKANSFLKSVKLLGEKKAIIKNEYEQEMEHSKIRPQKISEMTNSMADNEFYSKQSSTLDEFISSSMDSLDSLKRQSKYIDNISGKLKQGVLSIGVSSDLVNQIESRFAGDKSIFYILLILIVLLILFMRFVL